MALTISRQCAGQLAKLSASRVKSAVGSSDASSSKPAMSCDLAAKSRIHSWQLRVVSKPLLTGHLGNPGRESNRPCACATYELFWLAFQQLGYLSEGVIEKLNECGGVKSVDSEFLTGRRIS